VCRRDGTAHWKIGNLLSHVGNTVKEAAASCQYDPRGQSLFIPCAANIVPEEMPQLFCPRLQDFGLKMPNVACGCD
jgi:hypothetical protein